MVSPVMYGDQVIPDIDKVDARLLHLMAGRDRSTRTNWALCWTMMRSTCQAATLEVAMKRLLCLPFQQQQNRLRAICEQDRVQQPGEGETRRNQRHADKPLRR
jgi:hypothetical protein